MKTRVFVILFILLALTVTPALGKQIEDRIILWWLYETYDADLPFYVSHGWNQLGPPGHNMQTARFDLYIDGMKCQGNNPWCSPGIPRPSYAEEEDVWEVSWEYKFKKGLPPGEHTLHGEWLYKCGLWKLPEDCDDPDALIVRFEKDLVIQFVSP
jgi:hypothetical protein